MTTDEPTSEERYQRLSISPVTRDSVVDSLKMRPANADLSTDDVHYCSEDATELLNDAADMIRRAISTDPADPVTLNIMVLRWTEDAETWLRRFEELGR